MNGTLRNDTAIPIEAIAKIARNEYSTKIHFTFFKVISSLTEKLRDVFLSYLCYNITVMDSKKEYGVEK